MSGQIIVKNKSQLHDISKNKYPESTNHPYIWIFYKLSY